MPALPVERRSAMPNARFYTDPHKPDRFRERQPLAAIPDASPAARRFVTAQLRAWDLDQIIGRVGSHGEEKAVLAEAVELVAAELVTNSLAATGMQMPACYPDVQAVRLIELQLRVTGARLLCEVWDSSPELPKPATPTLGDENGRGLFLVSCYATDWTWYPSPSGQGKVTVAWWNLPRPAETDHPSWMRA
jgi:histidine kinase-like protein